MSDTSEPQPPAPRRPSRFADAVMGGADAAEPQVISTSPFRLVLLTAVVVALGMMSGANVLLVVAMFAFSVFLHESGHFLTAKWSGMKVTEFFIGFGPRIWSFRRGETEYGIKALWLGAYVRIVGMNNLEQVPQDDEPRTYRQQGYWRRLVVVLAGPGMNFLLAFVLFAVINMGYGVRSLDNWALRDVVDDTPAATAGLRPGDELVSIGGVSVRDWEDLGGVVAPRAGETVELVWLRDGERHHAEVRLVERLSEHGVARLVDLEVNDWVRVVDGESVDDFAAMRAALIDHAGESVTLGLVRDAQNVELDMDVPADIAERLPADGAKGFLGVGPDFPFARLGPAEGLGHAVHDVGGMTHNAVFGLRHFFSPDGLSRFADQVASGGEPATDDAATAEEEEAQAKARVISAVGIVQAGADQAEEGIVNLLYLVASLNVFLAVLNLIPLLPFDGGHAAVATYEAIRSRAGRRHYADVTRLLPLTYGVVALLLTVGLAAIYLDIVSPVGA